MSRHVGFSWGPSSDLVRRVVAVGAALGLVLGLLAARPAEAGTGDTAGTEFWLAFPANYPGYQAVLTLYISGVTSTTGSVSVPGLTFSEDFSVTPGEVTSVVVPTAAMITEVDGVQPYGVHVVAEDEVAVYGLNAYDHTSDAYLALPVDVLGTDHLVMSYASGLSGSQLSVVGALDGTTVTITPSVAVGGRDAGVPFAVELDAGEVYQLRSEGFDLSGDLTGSRVTSDAPVAVFGGHTCTNVPAQFPYCDHLVEQMPPTSAWGTTFVTVPLATRSGGDIFRVLADRDGTTVRVNGGVVATLDSGQFHEQLIDGPSTITADGPVLVAQYARGGSADGSTGDPFMMLVPPDEQFLADYTVATAEGLFSSHHLNLVLPTAAVASVRLDGVALPDGTFTPIGTSGYSGAAVTVGVGSHTITAAAPIGVFAYGFGQDDSYGYIGGMSMSEVALVTNVSLALDPPGQSATVGEELCAVATVTDGEGGTLANVRVDFVITGVHSANAFAATGPDGVARHCYTGTEEGVDDFTAAVGGVVDGASVTWQPPPPDVVVEAGAGSVWEGDSGITVMSIPVRLSGPSTVPVTVDWVTVSGPVAEPGVDYVEAAGTVTFAPGEIEAFIDISVLGDTIHEPGQLWRAEWMGVYLTSPTNARFGDRSEPQLGLGIIFDDDPLLVPA